MSSNYPNYNQRREPPPVLPKPTPYPGKGDQYDPDMGSYQQWKNRSVPGQSGQQHNNGQQYGGYDNLSGPMSSDSGHGGGSKVLGVVVSQPTPDVAMFSSHLGLPRSPVTLACPSCKMVVQSKVERSNSATTHGWACVLCACCFWPCACVPYCMSSCKNAAHFCPECHTYLGASI